MVIMIRASRQGSLVWVDVECFKGFTMDVCLHNGLAVITVREFDGNEGRLRQKDKGEQEEVWTGAGRVDKTFCNP